VGEYAVVTQHSFEVDVATRDDCSKGEERLGHWYRGGWGSYTTSIEAAAPRGCRGMRFV